MFEHLFGRRLEQQFPKHVLVLIARFPLPHHGVAIERQQPQRCRFHFAVLAPCGEHDIRAVDRGRHKHLIDLFAHTSGLRHRRIERRIGKRYIGLHAARRKILAADLPYRKDMRMGASLPFATGILQDRVIKTARQPFVGRDHDISGTRAFGSGKYFMFGLART